jgi:glycolate dehydrogenase FAD-binding subunit
VTLETTRSARADVQELTDPGRKHFAVDGLEPRLLAAPASAAEAAGMLGWAAEQRLAVATRGGGTRSGLGNVPRGLDLVLSTEKLSGVVEYEPADLTITVGAGTPLDDVQRALAERGQFLPLDPAAAGGSTIGGVVATNASGPARLRYGSARDLLIGSQVATALGTVARAGGKVVKNVTGYDLNKLYIGSLGTLAVLTELTFKVQPRPEAERTLVAQFADVGSAQAAVYRVLRSPLTPTAMELLTPTALASGRPDLPRTDRVVLVAQLAGFPKPLARMVADWTGFARDAGASEVEPWPASGEASLWESLRGGPSLASATELRVAVPISQLAGAVDVIDAGARAAGVTAAVQASAGVGVIRAAVSGGTTETLVALIRRLRAGVREQLGSVVVERCPLAVKRELDVLGEVPDSFEIMRRLKSQLDPAGIMNPGRFLGRL